MTDPLPFDGVLVAGAVVAGVAAAIHAAIFVLESVLWMRPAVRRMFGVRSDEAAAAIRPMAFNQGFYNLFLALGVATGLVMLAMPDLADAGLAITVFAALSMALAALVLVVSQPRLWRAAAIQGASPLLALALFGLAALG
ncbi:DUF1304 domain-containing protein [uncultured Schumannella sp.]|uniref:DUF1304 domain-containing protein n=1 Tax=uncultured Schumannella sp. TaxID=1195956 RepID=UPI0025FCB9D8|nr:DUF1304 domain-containing protein [uncultured Schumannella sp.]